MNNKETIEILSRLIEELELAIIKAKAQLEYQEDEKVGRVERDLAYEYQMDRVKKGG
jgi:hypothetical protein